MALDWTAFTSPVTPPQIQQWKAAAKAAGHRWAGNGTAAAVIVLVVISPMILITALLGFGSIGGAIVGLATGQEYGFLAGGFGLLFGFLMLGVAALLVWLCTKVFPNERRWERWLRLDWFARSNRLLFSPSDPNPNYPGAIFSRGGGRAAIDHFRSTEGRFFDFGNFQYVVSNGKSSQTITWGFLALNLERRLPHMLLDSIQNNSWASQGLAGLFARDQVLSLEGDFDRYFTLYCPREYERDALYVYTPDLMALCIDNAAPFDIEIVDDWMFVYSPRAFRMDDTRLLARMFQIIDVVGSKALRQTRRYHDDHIDAPFPANVVARPGQRLRRRFPLGIIIALVVALGLPVLFFLAIVLGALVTTAAGG